MTLPKNIRENSAKKLSEIKWSPGKILKNMYKPVYELFVAITKKRPEGRRTLIIIQVICNSNLVNNDSTYSFIRLQPIACSGLSLRTMLSAIHIF